MGLKTALQIVIDHIDGLMQEAPDRQLANISNYLEEVKAGLK